MIVQPDLHDIIGIAAFTCVALMLLLLAVIVGVSLAGITSVAWFKPVAMTLSVVLPVVFAVCVILSEVVR